MTIQAQLADGRVLEFPDGTDPSVVQATVKKVLSNPLAGQSTEALESAKSAPMSFGDTFKSLSSGVIGGGKSLVDFFGAGTGVSKGLGEAQSYLQESLSPERKAEISRRQELQDRAAKSGSLFQEAKAFVGGVTEAPIQSLAQALGSSAPAIVAGIAALPASAPTALALGVGTIAKLTVGAMQGVGEMKGGVFDAVKAEYMKQGKTEQEAEALAIKSSEYSRETALQTGGAALLGALDAFTGAEPSIAKAMRRASPTGELTKEARDAGIAALGKEPIKAPSYLGQLAKGVATEAPLEGAQGAFGQYGENVALQPTGADVTPMQGVLGAGLRDATVGALFGGVASPLSMKSARQEYATDQFLRQAKEDIELDKRAAELQKTQDKTKEALGGGKQLLLPAPGKTYEEPKDLLQDPVGRITEDELGKAIGDNTVVNYLNKYRRDNNLPKLKSYSVEDIKDAMTAQNPEGEEGALNSILAYKTGYKDETYTLDDINNIAVAKNVATETKGFSDFLTRATGKSDLNTMTQPQLHSVYQALNALPREGKEQQLVLPEGSNATRFTQDQYNQGVTTALMGVKQGRPVSLDQARNAVKAQTDLKTDRDADQVLKTAASNEDLIIERGTGFQAANKTGEVLGTYGTEAEARRNHRRADITPVETQLVRAPEEIKTDKTAKLPQGYGIEKTTEVGDERPAFYAIRVEGSQKDESQRFAEEVDAKDRLASLARGREANAKAKEAAADRIRQVLEKDQAKIVQMEADGLTGTSEHTKAVNAFKAANVTKSAQITSLLDEAEAFRAPLKIVPLGKKTAKVEKHTVTKGGKKLGTFPNKTEAEKSILSQADEQELQTIADRGGAFGKRAEVELGERKRTTPGIKVKGTTEGLEKAGVRTPEMEAKLKELEAKLKPMLDKFGLGNVALSVVRAINNDAEGSFKGTDKLIQIAFNATNPIKTMRHEALHALKELGFFTSQQWKALEKQAKDKWIGQYLENVKFDANTSRLQAYRNLGLTEDDIIEEAIADAFGDYETAGKAPPGMLEALFKRLQQFFKALRQALTGAGFESAEEIFGKIEGGELKAGKQAGGTEEKLSLAKPSSDVGHKREASTGRYVGAPEWVGSSPQQLASLRKKLRKLAVEGEPGRYWYERSSKAILDMFGGDKKEAEKFVSLIAIYSPNATVPANTSMALKAYYQYLTGEEIKAGLGEANKKATKLLKDNVAWSGIKTNSFYQNLMVEIDPSKLDPGVATMDMWMALAFDYGMKVLDQGPKYKFAEREIQNIAKDLGWSAHQVQAAIWTAMKGRIDPIRDALKAKEIELGIGEMYEDEGKMKYRVKADRKSDHFRLAHKMGMDFNLTPEAIEQSKYDFSDAIKDRSSQMSWEATPGATTKLLPGLLKAPIDEKFEYLTAIHDVLTDEDGYDVIAKKIGLPSGKTILGFSAWQGDIGAGAQTFTGVALEGGKDKRDVTPEARKLLNLYCAIKGFTLAQEAVVWQVPSYDGSIKNQNGIEGKFNQALTASEMNQLYAGLYDKFNTYDIAPGYTEDGFRLLNFTEIPNKEFHKGVKEVLESLPADFGGGMISATQYRSVGDYIGNDWINSPKGEDYAGQIASAGLPSRGGERSDLQQWATNLRSRVEAVNEKFSKKYDWGKSKLEDGAKAGAEDKLSLRTYFPTAEEAENAAYKKAPPGTAEFKRFFGGSRVMEEGRAQPMFHASMEDFNIFRENRPIFISPDAGFAEDFIKRRISESGSLNYLSESKSKTAKIYPLWVRAETPFDYENNDHVNQIMEHLYPKLPIANTSIEKEVKAGNWSRIEDPKFQAALKLFGYDSFYTNEGGAKNLAVFKANQVKSITGNLGSFDESGDIRYSLGKFLEPSQVKSVVYHGTTQDISEFKLADKAHRAGMPDGFYFTTDPDEASTYAGTGKGANVLSVYIQLVKPFIKDSKVTPAMVRQFEKELRENNPNLGDDWIQSKVASFKRSAERGSRWFPELFPNISFPADAMTRVLEAGKYDGFQDGRHWVVTKPTQVKSATGNVGTYDTKNPDIRYSLKPVSADIDAAIDRTTTAREEKGFIGRILEAIFPQSAGHFRQQALNRYNQLGVYDRMLADKMGGAAMLADQSAESAALMSDLSASVTASAFGYGNRTGGVPVYKNGITTIDTSVKGPIAILAPLAKYNNPRIYQRYQYWAGVKRGKRFMNVTMPDGTVVNKEKNFEPADIARAAQLEKDHPEFVQIQKEMNEFNNGLVKYMVQTGVIDPAKAKIYMEHADYIPFYRQMDGERTAGPNIFQSISGVKPPKALKFGEAPIADYLETIVRNTQSAIQSGMKNTAAQRAVNVAMQLGPKVGAQRLKTQESGFDIVQVLEKGERVSYRVADTLFIDACRSLNLPDLPFMGLLAFPANALRNLVTKDPGFMLANLMRDSLSSWVTSGTSVKPIIGTISGFTKALSGNSASMEALLNAGILGGYEFSSGVLKSGEVLETDLNKKYGKTTGAKVLLKPFTSLWDALERGTEASDAATRIAIYERVLADTGNEAEAIFRSLEVMNFNRKGSSAIIRIATAAIPFLNARMQGLDIFYRASFGRDTVADPAAKQKAFFVRGATLMALSIAAYIMVSDDDEYKKQEDETKDNYWIVPGVGKFPTPFEVGFLFKTVPERIYAAMFKDDTGEDLKEAMKRGIISTLGFNPIPQTVKPLMEAAWNYNSFTGRVIVGAGMENRSPEFQVGPSTSEVAQRIGSLSGLSPLKVDHVLQGYTGTIGMYAVQLVDSVLNANDNSPNASKRFEQLPIIKRFALDPEARGNITQFYALKNATDQAVTTINFLERSGDAEAYAKYFEENAGLLANKNYVNSIEKQMKRYREMRSMVQSAEMTGDEKRDLLIDIGRAENALNENIKEVKKAIKELQ